MITPVVDAVGISRHFDRDGQVVRALTPASFRILPGEHIALVGPSGSGKSTLLHLMAELDSPSEGVLSWPALGRSRLLRPNKIGMVFQTPSLLPMLNVVENVELPMLLTGDVPDARRRALVALAAVGLKGLAEKLPEELSGGQAQRVGLARALAHRPALILADEPTGQLDHTTARQVFDALLGALDGTATALIVATHDPTIASRLDVVWHLAHGRLDTAV